MLAVFSVADASIIVAIIVAGIGAYQTRRNGKELRPNGGSSTRDAIDRIETATNLQSLVLTQHDTRLRNIEKVVIQAAAKDTTP